MSVTGSVIMVSQSEVLLSLPYVISKISRVVLSTLAILIAASRDAKVA